MMLKETAPAPHTPVPVRAFADHLRLGHGFSDDGAEDALLDLYLRNATAVIERRSGQALVRRTYLLKVTCWDRRGHLTLPIGPISEIESIRFLTSGATVDLDPDDWHLTPGTHRQQVTGRHNGPLWPLPPGAIAELRFAAGHGQTWNDVPDDLVQAVLLTAAQFYENRFGEMEAEGGLPFGVLSIIERNRPVRL